ncbi:MAG: sulfur carrier protein ThiS [Crocinitomicaceae bacterium]|nr:sulfur carrier protein ThiS [Crocinitomicaceae bacterium]
MITIKVNERIEQVEKGISLQTALDTLNIQQNGIAVAVNQQIISKTDWLTKNVESNDELLIIKATQGG